MTTDTDLATLAAQVEALTAEVTALRTRVRDLEAPSPTSAPATTEPSAEPRSMGRTRPQVAAGMDRRRLLRDGLIAGAAATAAAVSTGTPAAADNGDPITIGQGNEGYGETLLLGSPFRVAVGAVGDPAGIGAMTGHAGGGFVLGANVGVVAYAEPDANIGLLAIGPVGAEVRSNLTHLRLGSITASTRQPPVFDPVAHQAGDIVRTTAGELWWCTTEGTPGQWVKLGGPTTAGSLHLLPAPVRVYDSRPGTTPSQGPKTPLPAGNVSRTIDTSANNSGVPKSLTASGGRFAATGVLLNVLLVNATAGNGNLTVWANDKTKPQSNSLVWGGSAGRFSTLAVTAVDANAQIKVDASLSTNLVIDVVGYYR